MLLVSIRRALLFSILILSLSATGVFAQGDVTIAGIVRDASGAAVGQAWVDAVVAGRAVETKATGAAGRYELRVPAGVPVEIRVRRDGFAEHIVTVPGSREAVARDITLQVGDVSDTLIVTASRGLESRATVTESVTILTRADLETLGSASLADAMKFVPGVNIESAGREGALASMFSRGGESDYNLVLIDGVRVNQSGGVFDFSRISAAEIDRVEVVRGAQSSLWGSDAMGSVVQIFTKRAGPADVPQLSGSVEGGSFSTLRSGAHLNGGIKQVVDYQAGVSHQRSDGAFAELLAEEDRFEQTAFDAALGGTLGSRASLRGAVRYTRAEGKSVGPIAFGARDSGGAYNTTDLSGHLDVSHLVGPRYTGTASFNYFRYESLSADTVGDPAFGTYAVLQGTPNAIFPGGTRLVRLIDATEFNALVAAGAAPGPGQFLASRQSSDFPFTSPNEFRRPAFRYQGDYAWGGHRLSAGYEAERESSPLTEAYDLINQSAFVQQRFAWGERWFATAGGRVDRKEGFDAFFSPKLSVGGYLLPFRGGAVSSLKVFGNIGKGIKSPSFSERLGSAFSDPAPDLKVERARTGDAGVEATFADQRYRALVTYFNNDYTDQIAYRGGAAGDGIPEYINIDGSTADGWELEWALQRPAAGFTASASYALVDNRVVTNLSTSQQFQPGQPLLRRPKHSGHVRAAYQKNRVTLSFHARMVGDRHDNSFLSLRTVPNAVRPAAITTDITVNPGYAVMGVGADIRAHATLSLFLRADNIGDAEYQSVLGYPGMPRAVIAGARVNLGARR